LTIGLYNTIVPPMPRTARLAPQENIYHILTRGNNRQVIFKDEDDYGRYIAILKHYKEKYRYLLYHYALMGNHVHLVIETTARGGSLAEIMKGINLSYAQHYKKKYKHTGHFWQDRYKSIIISDDDYLLACGSYVELNPVRARMVEDPKDYRWSSYPVYAYGHNDAVTDVHAIYRRLSADGGRRKKKYRESVKGMMETKKSLKGEMEKRQVYGNEGFVRQLTKSYDVSAVIKPVGRPKAAQGRTN
jgi:putative transposase